MKIVNKTKTLLEANENFGKSDFAQALRNYALVLQDHPDSKEAYNGAILAEMAMSGEEGAEALFDYYTVLREDDLDQANIILTEILETMDGTLEELGEIIAKPLKDRIEFEDGIMYAEFKEIVAEDGDFRRIFENIMFSTRVIITEKDDFVDFLDKLMENNYQEMALSYLEGALAVHPNDKQLRALLRRLAKGKPVEN